MNGALLVRNRQRTQRLHLGLLRQISTALIQDLLHRTEFDLCVHLVSAAEITRLNETCLSHRGPTDVIAFDYADLSQPASPCGEIFICLEEAQIQAGRFRTCWQNELVRYLVHGVLHLCDYDDGAPKARQKMKREEARLLRLLARRFHLPDLGAGPLPR